MKNLKDVLAEAKSNAQEEKARWQGNFIVGLFAVIFVGLLLSGNLPVLPDYVWWKEYLIILGIIVILLGIGFVISWLLPIGKVRLKSIKKWCYIVFEEEKADINKRIRQITEELEFLREEMVDGNKILLSEREDLAVLQACEVFLKSARAGELRSTANGLALRRDLGEEGIFVSEEEDLVEEIKISTMALEAIAGRIQSLKEELNELEQTLRAFQVNIQPYLPIKPIQFY